MKYYGISDRGSVRDENQDCCVAHKFAENAYLFIVCDGMGGQNGGKIASSTCASVFEKQMRRRLSRYLDSKNIPTKVQKDIPRYLEDSLQHANTELFEMAKSSPELSGMGTTLVALFVLGQKAYIINVGDSRAYFYASGNIMQITKDHSYVQFLLDSGKITQEEAEHHPKKNVIIRSVGVLESVVPDIFELDIIEGDTFLLCSDGLSNFVSESRIVKCISGNDDNEMRIRSLIDSVKLVSGTDNITALIAENI